LETVKKKPWVIFTALAIFFFGIYLSFLRGPHFSDGDSYSIINSFLTFLDTGTYFPSRGAYGHPIPETVLGFVSYNFGVISSNILSFVFFYLSIFFVANTFVEKNKFLFILLSFSNSILLIDNTNTIDYPFALLFFTVGFFFLRKSILLSAIFFALCIGSRANFALFIYPSLLVYFYFIDQSEIKIKIKKFLISCIITSSIGIIFYVPVFIANDFSISFIKIPFLTKDSSPGWYGGPEFSLISLAPRFVFKIYSILGIFSSLIIFYLLIINFFKFKLINKNNLIIFFIIIFNLTIFFFMPTKYLLINPFVIFLYVFLANTVSKKFLRVLIFLNLLQWLISFNLLEIKYKSENLCEAKHAISAKYTFEIDSGYLAKFFKSLNTAPCYEKELGKYSENYLNNRPLKISK
tara:strand:- start:13836 stop:15056 length:1221 start_codon:yes stop_codon:yes gene_type:complete